MIDVEFAANSLQFLEIEKLGKLSLLIIELFSDCTRIAGLMTGFSLFNKLRKYYFHFQGACLQEAQILSQLHGHAIRQEMPHHQYQKLGYYNVH